MPSDAEIALAFVAKRQGTESMAPSAWAHVMSLELGWMTPGAAKSFVADCQASGLLQEDGDDTRLAFDRKAVEVPRGFRPPADLGASPPSTPPASSDGTEAPPSTGGEDLFPRLVARIAEERSMRKDDVMDETAAVQERFGGRLSAESAAVHVALQHGVDVAEDAAAALERITSRSR